MSQLVLIPAMDDRRPLEPIKPAEGYENGKWNNIFTKPGEFERMAEASNMRLGEDASTDQGDFPYRMAMATFLSEYKGMPFEDSLNVFDDEKERWAKSANKTNATAKDMFDWTAEQFREDNKKQEAYDGVLQNVLRRSVEDALSGQDRPWMESIKPDLDATIGTLDDEQREDLLQKAQEVDIEARRTNWAIQDDARLLFRELQKTTGQVKPAEGEKTLSIGDLAERFADMPDERRKAIFNLVAAFGGLQGASKGFWYQMAESLGRGANVYYEGIPRNLSEDGLMDLKNEIEQTPDLIVTNTEKPFPVGLKTLDGGGVFQAPLEPTRTFNEFGRSVATILPQFRNNTRKATEADKQEMLKGINQQLAVLKVKREIRALADNEVDPIKSVTSLPNWIEQGLYGAVGSAPYTAAAMIPYIGFPAVYAAIYSQQKDDWINAGMPIDKARPLALTLAIPSAAIESLQATQLKRALPSLSGFFKSMTDPTRSNFYRFATQSILLNAEQAGQEYAQDSLSWFWQLAGSAIYNDVEKPTLPSASELTESALTTFVATFAMSLFSVGAIGFREVKRGRAAIQNKTALEQRGYSEHQIDRVLQAESEQEVRQVIQEEDQKRDPELVAKAAETILAKARDAGKLADVSNLGLPTVVRMDDGKYLVTGSNGEIIVEDADGLTAANVVDNALYRQLMQFAAVQKALIDSLVEVAGKDGIEVEFSVEEQKALDEMAGLTPEALAVRVAAWEAEHKASAEGLSFVTMGLNNVQRVKEGLYRSINKVAKATRPEAVMAALEEHAEGIFKIALAQGDFTSDEAAQWIKEYTAETQDVLLSKDFDGLDDAAKLKDLTEAMSAMSVAYFTGNVNRSRLNPKLRAFFERVAELMRAVVARSIKIKQAQAAGAIGADFEGFLARSVGLDFDQIVEARAFEAAQDFAGVDTQTASIAPQNLVAAHNLSLSNLLHAIKMGGIAVPSVAVINTDVSEFDGYGEITLIAKSDLIDPKQNKDSKVFNADIYSSRYPRAQFVSDENGRNNLKRFLEESGLPPSNKYSDSYGSIIDSVEEDGVIDGLKHKNRIALIFLKEKGITLAEDKNYAASTEAAKHPDYDEWIEGLPERIGLTGKERIFDGYTYSGKRRYLPHNLDTVVKILKRKLRNGEDFNYGAGNIRALVAKKFRSVQEIQKSRNLIISKSEMQAIKDEINNELLELADKHERDIQGFADDLQALAEGGAKNIAYLKEQYKDDVPFASMREFLNKLSNLPTDYFEAKIQRAVSVDEFEAAVVPDDVPDDAVRMLESRGVSVYRYNKNDSADRRAKVIQASNESGATFSIAPIVTAAEESAAMEDAIKDFERELSKPQQERLRRVAAVQFARVERENAEVLRAHDKEGKPLPAPNGQPSKLNRRQWVQVRTPLFKRWFGDWEALARGDKSVNPDSVSKAIDENGEPMVVYHGTQRAGFESFYPEQHFGTSEQANSLLQEKDMARTSLLGNKGFVLSDSLDFGENDAVYPTFLSIKNPKRVDDAGDGKGWEREIKKAKTQGHDGLIYGNSEEAGANGETGIDSYLTLSPNQIKSATANEGMFSGSNNITLSIAPLGKDAAQQAIPATARTQPAADAPVRQFDNAIVVGPTTFSIAAYHGTPHEIEGGMSLDKIGTGEGAQAYGWGLYFAENKDVAKTYIDINPSASLPPRRSFLGKESSPGSPEYHAASLLDGNHTLSQVRRDVERWIKEAHPKDTKGTEHLKHVREVLAQAKSKRDFRTLPRTGHLYTVSLDIEEGDLLDWDKPLSEQSERVQRIINEARQRSHYSGSQVQFSPDATGQQIYLEIIKSAYSTDRDGWSKILADAPSYEAAASIFLNTIGIPGIRYLDGNSRNSGEGTYNYVIFDESKIKITHKNGVAVDGQTFSIAPAQFSDLEGALLAMDKDPALRRERVALTLKRVKEIRQEFDEARERSELQNAEQSWKASQLEEEKASIIADLNAEEEKEALAAKRRNAEKFALRAENLDEADPKVKRLERESAKEETRIERTAKVKFDEKRKATESDYNSRIATAQRESAKNAKESAKNDPMHFVEAIAHMEAIINMLPPEARGNIGGYRKLASLKTADARVKYLQDRIAKVDEAMEEYLRKEFTKQIESLIEKAKPKLKPNKVLTGNLGSDVHQYVAKVEEAIHMTADQMSARMQAADIAIAEADDSADTSDLLQEWWILNTFGDLYTRDALHLDMARQELAEVIDTGRKQWRMIEEARRDMYAQESDALAATLKKKGKFTDPHIKAGKIVEQFFDGHLSLQQLLNRFTETPFLRSLKRRLAWAEQDTDIARSKHALALSDVIKNAIGPNATKADADNALHDLKTKLHAIEYQEGGEIKKRRLPITKAQEILSGKGDPKALNLTAEDVDAMREQIESVAGNMRKKFITWESKTRAEKASKGVTRGQAIFLLMSWAQPDVREKMERKGWTESDMAELGRITNDDVSRTIMEFLRKTYKEMGDRAEGVFQKIFGAPMPRPLNYSPTRWENAQSLSDLSPLGDVAEASGITPGAVKSRQNHNADVRTVDAVDVFFQHIAQMEHWIAMAEINRDLRGVLLSKKVRQGIEATYGKPYLQAFERNIDAVMRGGALKAGELMADVRFLSNLIAGKSVATLGFNMRTVFSQIDAFSRGLFAIPAKEYFKRLIDPNIWQKVPEAWKSDTVQRRIIAGSNPQVRFVYDAGRVNPSTMLRLGAYSFQPMQYMDAYLTSVTAAIVYDYHYTGSLKAGATEQIARKTAEEEMMFAVYNFSQPIGRANRSSREISGNIFMRGYMMFMSDARLKSALMYEAARNIAEGKGAAKDYRWIATIFAMALLTQASRNIFSGIFRPDDDDDVWGSYARALMTAPFEGFLGINTGFNALANVATGKKAYFGGKDPISNQFEIWHSASKDIDDVFQVDDIEAFLKEADKLTKAAAVHPTIATPAAVMNAVKDAKGLYDNLTEDDTHPRPKHRRNNR